MWQILALFAAFVSPEPGAGRIYEGVAYGPRQTMVCDWFSNFENSRFDRCRTSGGMIVPIEDGASLSCVPKLCDVLDARARRVARWTRADPVWGRFIVRLSGRVSTGSRPKRYLGDGTRSVLIERLIDVRRVGASFPSR
ncbi:hypothetical protein NS319_01530 [Sphingomonas sanguinis]|uniref:Uncharacterized protein n=1 Tax=Sphingomonas sanguinis TaxID=33051 RepID=A0A147I7A6_9SPHN|nr:hypothetical protein NS319_01530 [Sphingomonas sanguinis]